MQFSKLIKQKPYEHVEYVLRPHPLTFLPKIIFCIILFLLPAGMYFLIGQLSPQTLVSPALYPVLVLGGSIYLLSILLFFFSSFTDYYLDISVVTNDRIIDFEQSGLFDREVSELDLFRIQDVTTEVKGVIGTFFDYGDIFVHTASDNARIIFQKVPHPNDIRNELIRLSHVDREYHNIRAA